MFVCKALCRPAERSRTKLGLQAVIPFYREMPFACLVERSPTAKLTLLDESPGAWRSTGLLACLLGNEPILYSCSSWPRWERTRSWDWINLQAYVDNWILQPGTVAATCQLYRAFFRSEREGSHLLLYHTIPASPQVRKNVHCRQNHLLSLLLYKHVTK